MKPEKNLPANDNSGFVFTRENYIIMLIGVVVIALGYLLMVGGGSDDPNVFNPEIFNFQRLTLSPLMIIAGLLIEVYAIFRTPAK